MPDSKALQLDHEQFLASCWQRRAMLIPAAVPHFTPPISAAELAGLALEEDVESRIIRQHADTWTVQHGPFTTADFATDTTFSLLVQAVDQHVEAVDALCRMVTFIPRWRIDDVMVSYGNDGASVGPHYDNYDVFLLQGEGEKLWRLGPHCDDSSPTLPLEELRILAEFDTQQEFLLGPGDMLYVPPGLAHWGIARGESTTFSIGFRAPRLNDMLSRWVDDVLEHSGHDEFFVDAGRSVTQRSGEICSQDLDSALAQIQAHLAASPNTYRWFGELVTEPRDDGIVPQYDVQEALDKLCAQPSALALELAAKIAWTAYEGAPLVFASGESMPLPAELLPYIEHLCKTGRLGERKLAGLLKHEHGRILIHFLMENGCVYVER